ncbi:hypothetical protein GWI33_003281 [Rhynchophorus ferrugineus]|uniref:indole-3-glycerol-phosphate synthase n=1 Tax=Rhynchophorus ferrugineus TaxID=354439 RepID=A0A834IBJ5_RHYFE|nr:hypothetical protein GWI33_003281 [Rhynchophorus ferrugineus]
MVDPYHIIESRALEADCILLIVASLSDAQLQELSSVAFEYDMDVLVEVHNEAEMERALRLPEQCLLGVNNRNLKTFEVDLHTTVRLKDMAGLHRKIITESGISTPEHVQFMQDHGIDRFLVGEGFMKQPHAGHLMYTGIVLGTEKVITLEVHQGYNTLTISNEKGFLDDVFTGASVAINGTCLTVTEISPDIKQVKFDVADQTNRLTTLAQLKAGDEVNVERSFKLGMENGGHNLYGHIEGKARIHNLIRHGETLHLDIKIPEDKMQYFFHKGFVGLHGCSLTVNHVDHMQHLIAVDLIPETIRITNFKSVKIGDELNFEIDQTTRTLVDTIKATLQQNFPKV